MFLEMLVIAALSPVVVGATQAILFRLRMKQSRQGVTLIAMALGYIGIFAIASVVVTHPWSATTIVFVLLLYSFAAYTYFHVFNMSETSRRIRMLTEIASRGITKLGDLEAVYSDRDMVQIRLDRLEALGQIERRGDLYFPTGMTFALAAILFYRSSVLFGTPWAAVARWRNESGRRFTA